MFFQPVRKKTVMVLLRPRLRAASTNVANQQIHV